MSLGAQTSRLHKKVGAGRVPAGRLRSVSLHKKVGAGEGAGGTPADAGSADVSSAQGGAALLILVTATQLEDKNDREAWATVYVLVSAKVLA